MFFDQLCTAFDTHPRKLLRAGHILPCCPPAPALQPCAWVPHSTALWCMLCSTVSCLRCLDIHKPGCKVLAGGSQYNHILYAPPPCATGQRGISQVATWRKTGRKALYQQLHAKRNSAERSRKYFPCFLSSSWDCRSHTKNLWLLLRETNCSQEIMPLGRIAQK